MTARLSDNELATRVRASNRRRAERQRERRVAAGLVQTVVWLPASTRHALDLAARGRNETISATVAELLERALGLVMLTSSPAEPPPADTTPPVYTGGWDKAELMNEVAGMVNAGTGGREIARRLNAAGRRTASGAEFNGANLMRDFRAWLKKTGSADSTKDTAP